MSIDNSEDYIGEAIYSLKEQEARDKTRILIRLNLLMNRMDEMSKAEQIALMGLRLWRAANPNETITRERIGYYYDHALEALNGGDTCQN